MMAMVRSVSAFGPIAARPMIRNNARKSDVKMFVYWSIKSTFDLVRFGLGQGGDKFKGTGVFSFIEFDRKKDASSSTDTDSLVNVSKKSMDDKEQQEK